MVVNRLLSDGQSKTGSPCFTERNNGLEEAFANLLMNAGPGVGQRFLDTALVDFPERRPS